MPNPPSAHLVLASTSRYRRELLNRLNIPFEVAAPNADETPLPGETPQALALRLASAKARAVQDVWPDALIIGSDQVALVDNVILSKPGNFDNAVVQLKLMRGKAVHFFTALCLLNSRNGQQQAALVPVTVHMREYSDAQLERYLRTEEPYDCAGSARIEGLGITLVAKLEGDDPNALIGLPLIALCDMLRNEGMELP
ncbi:MAG: Maf family nucleotide pyrophosphatase [Betaproteobacteria bacterium]|nr:Maf family nucleotide pyrophosphatase [Betaproteobacteria bacterium]